MLPAPIFNNIFRPMDTAWLMMVGRKPRIVDWALCIFVFATTGWDRDPFNERGVVLWEGGGWLFSGVGVIKSSRG
jgi:hypothetical protein